MATANQRGRPNYGGKYANLHKLILVHNHGKQIINQEILKRAEETHDGFYERHFNVTNEITAESAAESRNVKP